ncbi:MAG: DJ-1/PfpI family protein, partial [Bdellovibrionales bacterium]|nr:DJ-1/PfpI family protein [Bdellovibrionales bacterium]
MKDVIALLYPGCIFFELALASELLSKKYNIRYVTPDGSDHLANNGMVLKAYGAFKDVNMDNVAAILVPGGNFDSVKDDLDSDRLLQIAFDKKIWLAAICGGPFLLGKAGVLKDKKIAHGFNANQLLFLSPYFEGTTFTDDKWVSDQNILTARPEAHIEFAVELAARLMAINPVDVTRTKEYYRGGVSKIRPIS